MIDFRVVFGCVALFTMVVGAFAVYFYVDGYPHDPDSEAFVVLGVMSMLFGCVCLLIALYLPD